MEDLNTLVSPTDRSKVYARALTFVDLVREIAELDSEDPNKGERALALLRNVEALCSQYASLPEELRTSSPATICVVSVFTRLGIELEVLLKSDPSAQERLDKALIAAMGHHWRMLTQPIPA